jgi:hypothetical protein
MSQADVDKKGTLDYGKFASLTLQLQMLDNDEYLRNAFSSFDRDGNGFIDLYELTQALTEESNPNSGVIRAIMNEVDTDKVRTFLFGFFLVWKPFPKCVFLVGEMHILVSSLCIFFSKLENNQHSPYIFITRMGG